jgi:hypothetical protein
MKIKLELIRCVNEDIIFEKTIVCRLARQTYRS